MKKTIKQTVGIDVAQAELVVCYAKMGDDFSIDTSLVKAFKNTKAGIEDMQNWVKKKSIPDLPLNYVCEATGVYHELMVYQLTDEGNTVNVVLPNKISSFMRSLEIKTITDFTAAQAIAEFGFRKLESWKKPDATYKKLKHLTRERAQIVEDRTALKNQLHAEKAQAEPHQTSINRIENRIKLLNKHEKEVLKELHQTIINNKSVREKVEIISSIPGVAELTAGTILAETDGFSLIKSKKQLSSYAGLDVKEKQSGTSVKGKPRISKRGNKHLRKALHMPALAAIRHEQQFRILFARLVSKHGIKMKAAVAVQRKLLELSFTLIKKNEKYITPKIEIEKSEIIVRVEKLESELI